MKTVKPHIPAFTASRGTWRLHGTTSTGRYTCTDEYRLIGTDTFMEVDRDKLHEMAEQGKVAVLTGRLDEYF